MKIEDAVLWFLILFPSLLIYSSLSLREMLVLNSMLLAFWLMIKRYYWVMPIPLYFLYLIKPQNAMIVFLFSALYLVFGIDKGRLTFKKAVVFLSGFIALGLGSLSFVYNKLNGVRHLFFRENSSSCFSSINASQCNTSFQAITDIPSLIWQLTKGLWSGLLSPLPWSASNPIQFVQAAENILVLGFIVFFVCKTIKIIPSQTIFWLLFLLFSLTLYGFLVLNVGTLVRYKMSFVVCFFIMLSYELERVKKVGNYSSVQQEMYEKSTDLG